MRVEEFPISAVVIIILVITTIIIIINSKQQQQQQQQCNLLLKGTKVPWSAAAICPLH